MIRNGVHFFTGETGAEALKRAREGRDYIVWEPIGKRAPYLALRCRLQSRMTREHHEEASTRSNEWCRVRAYSRADALAHYDRAFEQWRRYEDRHAVELFNRRRVQS